MPDRSVVVRLIADTSQYSNQMRNAARGTRDVGDAGEETSDRLGGLKKVLATVGGASVAKLGVDFNAMKQQAQASFTTITGSAKTANAELTTLQRDFGASQFGFDTVVKVGQRLSTLNIPLSDVNSMLHSISDAVSAVGGGGEEFDRIATSLGQMVNKGKVQAEEMMQLAEANIPAWQLLAKEIGVSVPEAMKRVQRGEVSGLAGVKALTRGMSEEFKGATERMADTWPAMLARLKAATEQAAGEVVKPLMRIASDGAAAVQPLLRQAGNLGNAFSNLPTPVQNTALALGAVALFSGRLNSAWARSTVSMGAFGAQMRVQQSLAAMSGASLSRLGAAATVAGMRFRAAGAAAMSAFGGPIGIALIAATIGLSIYQDRQAKAAEAAQKHAAAVDELSNSLSRNTLQLDANGRLTQVDSFLANATYGKDQGGTPFKLLEWLDRIPGAAQLARQALAGNESAMSKLSAAVKDKFGTTEIAPLILIKDRFDSIKDAVNRTARDMGLRIPDAAKATGASASTLSAALKSTAAGAGTLQQNLRDSGLNARQTALAYAILTGASGQAAAGARQMGYDFAAAGQAIAQSASQFVNPTGAWDAAVQANTPVAGSGAAKQPKQPQLSDDPAYRKAKKAAEDQRRVMRDQRTADRDRIRGAREVAKADADAATAATKRAAAMKKAADEAKRASDQAKKAVQDAQEQKTRADRNAADAAALAAAIKQQSKRAGSMDSAAWKRAQATANAAASSTASTARSAGAVLAEAKTDAGAKARAEQDAKTAAGKAAAVAASEKRQADSSKRLAERTAAQIERIKANSQRRLDALLRAQERAQRRFEKRSQDSAAESTSAVSGSYSSMAKNVKVSLDDYLGQLRIQVRAQERWKSDLLGLAAKIPPGMVAELAKLGPQAAPLIHSLSTGTKRQLGDFVRLFGKAGGDAGTAVADQLTAAIPLIGAAASTAGSGAASKLAKAIRDGRVTVAEAMKNLTRNGVDLTLGLKNKAQIEAYINGLSRKRVNLQGTITVSTRKRTPIKDSKGNVVGVRYGGGSAQVIGLAKGGWVTGGSGMKDDVRIPVAKDAFGLRAMGGEFMVRRDIAQANKGFFNTLNRTGKIPTAAPQIVAPRIVLPTQAPTRQINNHFYAGAFVQRDGQSVADMYREFDRRAGMGAGPG